MAGENAPSLQRDDGRLCERLHVVHDRRLAEIADGHREWRADARLAWLTLERLDQRRFFAADIGAAPTWISMSKSKPCAPQMLTPRC